LVSKTIPGIEVLFFLPPFIVREGRALYSHHVW